MFKKDPYEFEPIKELVLTMHYGFIDGFKKGWNNISMLWLDKLKQHLKNAGNRSINQFCLKRLTGILNLDELVKKICQPTEENEQEEIEDDFALQEEDEDKKEEKKTTESLNWD